MIELNQQEKDIREHSHDIFYSKRYNDDQFEYRYLAGYDQKIIFI
jgi:hypothetical protein